MPNKNSNRTPERAETTLHALFWQNKKAESQLSYIKEMLTMLPAYEQNELMWSEMPLDRRKAGRSCSNCRKEKPQAASCNSFCIEYTSAYKAGRAFFWHTNLEATINL